MSIHQSVLLGVNEVDIKLTDLKITEQLRYPVTFVGIDSQNIYTFICVISVVGTYDLLSFFNEPASDKTKHLTYAPSEDQSVRYRNGDAWGP